MDYEVHYELISRLYTFEIWDKVSDVNGIVSLLPSVSQKHKKLIEEADRVLTIYKKIKAKDSREQKKIEEMIAFATREKGNALKFKQSIDATLSSYANMKIPVIVSHSGIPQEVIDISCYPEVKNLSEEEALTWFRNYFLSDVMEKAKKSGFYGDDFGKMCLRMRADLDILYEWVKSIQDMIPSAPPIPVLKTLDEDEEADNLFEKAVLCKALKLSDLPDKKQEKIAQKIKLAAQKGYVTKRMNDEANLFLQKYNKKEK